MLLSFRYVTDGGVDEPGWWIDNVEVGGNSISDGSALQEWQARDPDETPTTATVSIDREHRARGAESVRIDSNAKVGIWRYPKSQDAAWNLADKDFMALWVSLQHETRDGFEGAQPAVRLKTDANDYIEYVPRWNYLNPSQIPYSEGRDGWQDLNIPLTGSRDWEKKVVGTPSLDSVRYLEVVTSSRGGPYTLWLDGLAFGKTPTEPDIAPDVAVNPAATGYPRPSASHTFQGDPHLPEYDNLWAPMDGSRDNGHIWSDWNSGNSSDWYQVDFGADREVNRVKVYFVSDGNRLQPPKSFAIQYWSDGGWRSVENPARSGDTPVEGLNSVSFDTVFSSKLRLVVENRSGERGQGAYTGISELQVFNTGNLAGNQQGRDGEFGSPVASASSNDAAVWRPIDGSIKDDSAWIPAQTDGQTSWLAVDFVRRKLFNKVNLYLYADGQQTALPSDLAVEYWTGSAWAGVDNPWAKNTRLVPGRNTISFNTVRSRKVRVIFHNEDGAAPELRELETGNSNLVWTPPNSDLQVTPSASYTFPGDTVWGPLDGSYADSPRWTAWNSRNPEDWYAVEFSRPKTFARMNLFFYNDNGGVKPPRDYKVQYWNGSAWIEVQEIDRSPQNPAEGFNTVTFRPVTGTKVRVLGTNQNPVSFGVYIGLTELEVFRWD